ncbi:MAG: CDP-alcohol phosphatidyltransferase family protein [Candidatus Marinimicrobia bacterium]|nr:CDP-alcohol phosphatidyltransferase family protein [Candidatus Neomarinimicrobiota bacterium]MCF7828803.1 CDP-alcohol phosphatidyltransferase family protein [Candidatus Neomarinimicrobiota bacterium]MCF7880720.1 CDP-alcohol phosphatidyltransferase family protein [Candidatus Neomarinimicrobiota bacterium]
MDNRTILENLQSRIRLLIIVLAIIPGVMMLWLRTAFSGDVAMRWFLGVALVFFYITTEFYHRLNQNRPPNGDRLFPSLGIANTITFFRGFLLALLAGLIFSPEILSRAPYLPAILYLLAGILDGFDGHIARRRDHISSLGQMLENRFDALGILVASTMGIALGKLPVWYMSIGLAYYLFILGRKWRLRTGKPVIELQPDRFRSVAAGIQMGFLGIALLPIFPGEITKIAAPGFFIPTVYLFLRDWLITAGIIDSVGGRYRSFVSKIKGTGRWILLPVIRIGIAGAFLWGVLSGGYHMTPGYMVVGILTLFVFMGVTAQITAIVLMCALGITLQPGAISPQTFIIIYCSIAILFFGSGRFSLWRPEEQFLFRQR